MKLQKNTSVKIKDKKYYKYSINIPTKQIKRLGWEKGARLNSKIIRKKRLVVKALNGSLPSSSLSNVPHTNK